MLGAIAGDIIGSPFERDPIKTTEFPLVVARSTFTDDTVLTVAVAHAILEGVTYGVALRAFGRRYPYAGYGGSFVRWLQVEESPPYFSWGNGSAMRVSPVGWAFDTVEEVLREAERSAEVTHNHPEGIKGAQAVALAVFLARMGSSKAEIGEEIGRRFAYDLGQTLEQIRPGYRFDVSCPGSVPPSIVAFLESEGVEDAIRKAISLGGDSDTMACIAGAIAEAYYGGVPARIVRQIGARLPQELVDVVDAFRRRFSPGMVGLARLAGAEPSPPDPEAAPRPGLRTPDEG